MNKESLIKKIVMAEWDMFQEVQNVGGKASCQEDFNTFEITRACQFESWPDTALESYSDDIEKAKLKKRNLLTEKYARMMESTSPKEFRKIKRRIPRLDPDVPELIDKILIILLKCEKELMQKYPNVAIRGRAIYTSEDTPFTTSKETYFRGEMATYSVKTLGFYHDHISELDANGKNISEIVLEETVKRYGYNSLTEANEILKNQPVEGA